MTFIKHSLFSIALVVVLIERSFATSVLVIEIKKGIVYLAADGLQRQSLSGQRSPFCKIKKLGHDHLADFDSDPTTTINQGLQRAADTDPTSVGRPFSILRFTSQGSMWLEFGECKKTEPVKPSPPHQSTLKRRRP